MPGIADIQPIVMPNVRPSVAGISAVTPGSASDFSRLLIEQGRAAEETQKSWGAEQQARNMQAREAMSPLAQKARKMSMQEQADVNNKFAYERFLKSGRPLPTDENGNVDHTAATQQGGALLQADQEMQTAILGMQAQPKVVPDAKGNYVVIQANSIGENVSPGSEAYKRYQKAISHSMEVLHGDLFSSGLTTHKHAHTDLSQTFGESPSATGPESMITPVPAKAPPVSAATSPVLVEPKVAPAPAPQPIKPQIPSAVGPLTDWTQKIPMGTPQAAPTITIQPSHPAAPAITVQPSAPAAPAAQPEIDLTGGIPWKGDQTKAIEMMKDVRAQEGYKNWAEKAPAINRFKSIVASYGDAKDGVTTQKDIALATTARQMLTLSSSGAMRGMSEMSSKALDESEYLLYKAQNLPQKLLKQEMLTPQTRQLIIDETQRAVSALETDARLTIGSGAQQISSVTKTDPKDFLNTQEINLLTGQSSAPGAAGQSSGLPPKQVTIGGKVYYTPR